MGEVSSLGQSTKHHTHTLPPSPSTEFVRRKPGMMHSCFVEMRSRWSQDYSFQGHVYKELPPPPLPVPKAPISLSWDYFLLPRNSRSSL